MSDLTLFIGDKDLSSWSLRPWLVMKHAGVEFTERMIRLDQPETKTVIADASPSKRVPCLMDGALAVWESLSICEYLAEKFPGKHLWPADSDARAVARSVSCEMHAEFSALRTIWPMHFAREGMRHTTHGVQSDIGRIIEIWESCRRDFGEAGGGPFLLAPFRSPMRCSPLSSRALRPMGRCRCPSAPERGWR